MNGHQQQTQRIDSFAFLGATSIEWHKVWGRLILEDAKIRGGFSQASQVSEDPTTGETWQYMGTEHDHTSGAWFHTFRHRCHPATGLRVYLHLAASIGWRPDEDPGMIGLEVRGPEQV